MAFDPVSHISFPGQPGQDLFFLTCGTKQETAHIRCVSTNRNTSVMWSLDKAWCTTQYTQQQIVFLTFHWIITSIFPYERTVRHHTDFSLRNRLETIWCAIWLHQTVLFSITYVRGYIEKAMAAIHVSNFFHSTYFVFSSIFRHWLQASWLQGTWLQWGTQVYHIPGWPGHYCWL